MGIVTDKVACRAQEVYDRYRFGIFSWDRKKYNKPLFVFLSKIKKNNRVYDIGCGAGYWMEIYHQMGITKDQITALDLSLTNVENLKRDGYNAICGSLLYLPFSKNVSDFTICNGVLHHTCDPFLAFRELVRITKPGGYIFVNVYNKWHPWFYLVHKSTFPIRYIYWHLNKKIVNIIYPISKIFFQPLALLLLGRFLNDKDGMTNFMDQVITPRAYLFSKSKLLSYAKEFNCEIKEFEYCSIMNLMIAAQIKRN